MNQFFPNVPQDTPVYQLLTDHFLDDDTLHYAGEQIAYDGEPSEHMAPLNDAARTRMRAMLDHLDECAREKAALVGRPYRGRLTDVADLLAQAAQDQKILQERAQTETIRRAMPVVPDKPAPPTPATASLSDRRRAALAKTTVRASVPPQQPKRGPGVEPIHRPGMDRLTEKAPVEG
jgi:hypothetical protein